MLGRVPERPIGANPGLKFCSDFVFFLPLYCLEKHVVLCLPYLALKAVFCKLELHLFRQENLGYRFDLCPGHQITINSLALFRSTGAHNPESTTPILTLCNGDLTDQFILKSFCGTFSYEKGRIVPYVCASIGR